MARRHSFRLRVAAAFAGLGATLSILLSAGIWIAALDVSQRLMDQTLKAELDDYMARRERNPRSLPPDSASLRGYVARIGEAADHVPAEIRGLPPGQHEVSLGDTPFRAAVADRGGERYYILFNQERQKLREQRFVSYLVAGAVIMTLLSTLGGLWLAGRVITPVTELARSVRAAPPDNPPRLAVEGDPADEIAELANAFDRYLARLAAFIERERAFAADASHELRTPLAVIRGAAEVLADDPSLSPAQAGRVARIERAAAQMSELIPALLLLSREEPAPADARCDAAQLARDCIGRHTPLALERGIALKLEAPAPVSLPVPSAMFAMVIANLVHNAIVHAAHGSVGVSLSDDRLVVSDTGPGIDQQELGQVFDRYHKGPDSEGAGIGLSLVKRICDRHGWRIALTSRPGGGTTATLHFTA